MARLLHVAEFNGGGVLQLCKCLLLKCHDLSEELLAGIFTDVKELRSELN